MNTRTKILTASIAAVALTGAVGAGLAAADPARPSPTPTPSASASDKPGRQADGNKLHRTLQRRALHGEVTLGGKQNRVIDFQRGTVEKVSATSVTVKSADGFTATYTVDATTKVRKNAEEAKISDVKVQDRVRVVATDDGSTVTAKVIRDRGTGKR